MTIPIKVHYTVEKGQIVEKNIESADIPDVDVAELFARRVCIDAPQKEKNQSEERSNV